jgi:hypothetical protein
MTKDYKIGICFFSANHAALIEILGLIVKYKRFQQEKQFSVAHVDIHMLFADINISSVISKKGSVMMYISSVISKKGSVMMYISSVISKKGSVMMYISSVISKKGSVMMLYILYMNVIGNPTLHVDTY